MFHYRILQQLNNESAAEPDSLTTLLSNLEKKEEEFEQKDLNHLATSCSLNGVSVVFPNI